MGGGFGGMMGGMRGLQSGGMNSPNLDQLTDEGIVGSAYDNKVVMRLLTYLKPYKLRVLAAVSAISIYTIGNVSVPLFILLGIDWAINQGDKNALNIVGAVFLVITTLYCGAMYLQYVMMPMLGQSILFALRTQMFNHLQALSPSFFHRTPVGRIMSRSQSDVLQLTETFELMVQSIACLLYTSPSPRDATLSRMPSSA